MVVPEPEERQPGRTQDRRAVKAGSENRRVRRSYSALVFGGPWLVGLAGLSLVLYALLAARSTGLQVAALSGGIIMAIVGFLSVRISGPVEVTPRGVRGSLDTIPPDALYIARHAAESAAYAVASDDRAYESYESRSIVAGNAAYQALTALSFVQQVTEFIDDERLRRVLLALAATGQGFERELVHDVRTALMEQLELALRDSESKIDTQRFESLIKALGQHWQSQAAGVPPTLPTIDTDPRDESLDDDRGR
jgi:hypothetical protein